MRRYVIEGTTETGEWCRSGTARPWVVWDQLAHDWTGPRWPCRWLARLWATLCAWVRP